jgi:hypothetical protein
LPANRSFEVPGDLRLVAVPLFELFDKKEKYGPILSSIPILASRLLFVN